jgi:hypothetical protein
MFWVLFALAAFSLLWLHVTVLGMKREAAHHEAI